MTVSRLSLHVYDYKQVNVLYIKFHSKSATSINTSYIHNTNTLILYWYCKDKADIDKLSGSKEPSP